jgi:hypothetical protein
VLEILLADAVGEFDLNGQDAVIATLDNEVDLVLLSTSPEVLDRCFGGLSEYPNAERNEGLEQVSEKGTVPWDRRTQPPGIEESVDIGAKETGFECGIGKVVLRR